MKAPINRLQEQSNHFETEQALQMNYGQKKIQKGICLGWNLQIDILEHYKLCRLIDQSRLH